MSIIPWEPGQRPGTSPYDPHGTVAGNRPGKGGGSGWAAPPKGFNWRQAEEKRLRKYLQGLIKAKQYKKAKTVLRGLGYGLDESNVWGDRAASARDAYMRGMEPSKWQEWWNRRRARVQSQQNKGKGSGVTGNNPNQPGASVGPQGGQNNNSTEFLWDLPNGGNIGSFLNPDAYRTAGAMLMDDDYADELAGLEYDSAIDEILRQAGLVPRQREQNLHDISNWYGQVLGHQKQAAERNKLEGERALGSIEAITQGVLSSLGGEANPASGVVGSAGASDAATTRQMAMAENQYQADLTPLLELERSGQMQAEGARMDRLAADLAAQLTGLRKEKGAARSKYAFDIDRYNNEVRENRTGRLMDIHQYNNNLRQQRWQNQLSSKQAQIAAALTGAQIDYYNSGNQPTGGFIPWDNLDVAQRGDLINAAISQVVDSDGSLIYENPQQAMSAAHQWLVSNGYKASRPAIQNMLRTAINRAIQVRRNREAIERTRAS